MAQKVLSFTFNKKKYVSKPWNFRAACLVQENTVRQMEGKNFGIFSACSNAVDYLFEGTEATSEILDKAVSAKMRMCNEVWSWYTDDFTGKNEEGRKEAETETEAAN